jgi:hypothetical protein
LAGPAVSLPEISGQISAANAAKSVMNQQLWVILVALPHPLCRADSAEYEHCRFRNFSVLFDTVTVS